MTHTPDPEPITVSEVIAALGADVIQASCQVGEYSIRAAKRDKKFPASWFDAIESLCAENDLPCPRDLFAFKRPQEDAEPTSQYRLGSLSKGAAC